MSSSGLVSGDWAVPVDPGDVGHGCDLPDPASVPAMWTMCGCGMAHTKFGAGWRVNHVLTEMIKEAGAVSGTVQIFQMRRDRDVTGFSGVGIMADGAVFPDGVAVLRWRVRPGKPQSTEIFSDARELVDVHGHDGASVFVWGCGDARVFELRRTHHTLVADGVGFPDGQMVVRWRARPGSVARTEMFDSAEDFAAQHGSGLDARLARVAPARADGGQRDEMAGEISRAD